MYELLNYSSISYFKTPRLKYIKFKELMADMYCFEKISFRAWLCILEYESLCLECFVVPVLEVDIFSSLLIYNAITE